MPAPETVPSAPDDNPPLTSPFRSLLDLLKKGEVDTDDLMIDQD
jgi:hypothetical protein